MESLEKTYQLKSYFTPNLIEAGVDEVGRGSLAGPVVAAAVILPKDYYHPKLTDSKLLHEEEREILKIDILNNCLDYAIGEIDNQRIDEVNILYASFLAMHSALDKLKIRPELILVDGNKFLPYNFIPYHCEIKGDGKYASIAAASIIAKCHRDELMKRLSKKFPHYYWHENVGYPTKKHRDAIKIHGISPFHRLTYKNVKE
ncbi:MAG: ribonuclease HII [Cytophagales bacterium]|nr:ribonuclease HII [Cytophagales bacterium]